MDHQELESKLKATVSLASEGENFLNHVLEHRPMEAFFRGHFEYLARQGRRNLEELEKATAVEQNRDLLNLERVNAAKIVTLLEQMQTASLNDSSLRKTQQKLAAVRDELQKAAP